MSPMSTFLKRRLPLASPTVDKVYQWNLIRSGNLVALAATRSGTFTPIAPRKKARRRSTFANSFFNSLTKNEMIFSYMRRLMSCKNPKTVKMTTMMQRIFIRTRNALFPSLSRALNSLHMHHKEQKDSHFFLFPETDILSIHATPSRCTVPMESNTQTFSAPNDAANEQGEQNWDSKPTPKKPYIQHTPLTLNWIIDWLQDSPDHAIPLLQDWEHLKQRQEINNVTMGHNNDMKPDKAAKAIEELKMSTCYVRGTSTNRLAVSTIVKNPNSGNKFKTKTLIDCGCEGCIIDKQFIEEQGIQTKKLWLSISVYNADGTLNSSGLISEHITLDTEMINLGLSSHDIYLGHDWLKCHNLNIVWRQGLIKFDWCPPTCHINSMLKEPQIQINNLKFQDSKIADTLEDRDRLLLIDSTPIICIWAGSNIATELTIIKKEPNNGKKLFLVISMIFHMYLSRKILTNSPHIVPGCYVP
jgi:hypothetical protein